MAITQVKIRASISIGTTVVVTPYIQSFSVRKQRGQIGSFEASLKVNSDQVTGSITGDSVKIFAGEGSNLPQIFTGVVRSAKISPCFDDPEYVILSISGVDNMNVLQGKKYTRRCRASKTAWCSITGVVRRGLKSGKFTYNTDPIIYKDAGLGKKEDNRTAYAPVGPPADKKGPENEKNTVAALNISPYTETVV